MTIKLWELLFAGFFLPAFWFFWMWFFRIAAAAIVGKLISGIKNKALNKLKGDQSNAEGTG